MTMTMSKLADVCEINLMGPSDHGEYVVECLTHERVADATDFQRALNAISAHAYAMGAAGAMRAAVGDLRDFATWAEGPDGAHLAKLQEPVQQVVADSVRHAALGFEKVAELFTEHG
jgi:hypothetical protein